MRRTLAFLLATCMLLLSACSGSEDTEGNVSLFYAVPSDENAGSAIGSESAFLEDVTVETLLERLFEGPEDSISLSDTFPSGTALQSWTMEGETITVDLTESFSRLTGFSLICAEYCIVLTLSQLDTVSAVCITADGQTIPGGAEGALTADDVLLQGATADPTEDENPSDAQPTG